MNIKGRLINIFETQQITDSFSKREFVVEYAENPKYPELIKMEFIQDKCEILNSYNSGDLVDVDFNLKGRSWINPEGEVKYFNTIHAWKISKQSQVSNEIADDDDGLPY